MQLAELDAELAGQRDKLSRAKHERDTLRTENVKLRGQVRRQISPKGLV